MTNATTSRLAHPGLSEALAQTGRWIHANGWAPATSGNYSARDGDGIAITTSGRDKSQLAADHIILLDGEGRPLSHGRPSAETGLHVGIYRRRPDAGAVLHTHSIAATVLSRRIGAGGTLSITDHCTALRIPVLANSQDMAELGAAADAALAADPDLRAYLIAGHGTYTWAGTLDAARMQVEALEFLFACELHHRPEAACLS